MASFADKPLHEFTLDEWEQFLADDPPDAGIRLKLRKKSSSAPGITWQEALDVALCYGWIDGQAGRFATTRCRRSRRGARTARGRRSTRAMSPG